MDGLIIEKLNTSQVSEFQILITLFNNMFESPVLKVASEEFCESTLKDDRFIVISAKKSKEIIGGITAHILPSYYHGTLEIFIYDLAVSKKHQRMGVGRALMNALFAEAAERKIKILFVDAELEDQEALLFYEAIGGEKLATSQFTFQL